MNRTLSEKPGVGRVSVCGHCDGVHVAVGSVTLNLPEETFLAVSELLQAAVRSGKLSSKAAHDVALRGLFGRQ